MTFINKKCLGLNAGIFSSVNISVSYVAVISLMFSTISDHAFTDLVSSIVAFSTMPYTT